MKAAVVLALCAVAAWLPQVGLAQQPTLPPEAEEGFTRLTGRVAAGALGPGVQLDDIDIAPQHAQLRGRAPAGTWMATLSHPEGVASAAPRWFALQLEPPSACIDRGRLAQLLDEAFAHDPWRSPSRPAEPQRLRPLSENLRRDLDDHRVPLVEGTVPRAWTLGVIALLALGLSGVVLLLLGTRPRDR